MPVPCRTMQRSRAILVAGSTAVRSMNSLEPETRVAGVPNEQACRATLTTNIKGKAASSLRKPAVVCEFTDGPGRAASSDLARAPVERRPPFVPERYLIPRRVPPSALRLHLGKQPGTATTILTPECCLFFATPHRQSEYTGCPAARILQRRTRRAHQASRRERCTSTRESHDPLVVRLLPP